MASPVPLGSPVPLPGEQLKQALHTFCM